VQEGEYPNRLDPRNPVYAEETSPSVIVNGFSERLQASHIQRIRPHSENLAGSRTPHLAMDGDRDSDPHWNNGLKSLGPNEKQKEGEQPARHPRAVRGPGPARCAAPRVPGQEVVAPSPGTPAFPAAVLVAECGGSRHSDRGGTGGNISRSVPEPLRLKGPMGEAATRAAFLLANSQHLCHRNSGCKFSQIQPTTQSPQNPRALCIHLPADPETPDKPSVHCKPSGLAACGTAVTSSRPGTNQAAPIEPEQRAPHHSHRAKLRSSPSCTHSAPKPVQEGEHPNRLDPKNPVYAEETSPSAIVNDFSENPHASHIQRIWPHSENLDICGFQITDGELYQNPSSGEGRRYRRRPTLEHRTEPPKVQMKSRRRKNMKKEIRAARDAITH
ncbi:hypothetical protein U0070_015675, partial [Myodes glareolus]